ncbi:MAG TPA: PRC-barrel domain-containing protein [Chloroflexota bacterium]|jgi:sporulation protein YlmC with PRC-barrel domain|nr:PRC-barrel domain-containing protein [Chloroflexota bacterium]
MRLRFHELVGKRVLAADGRLVGTIQDLVAEPVEGELRVTALLVGYGALARRIAFRRAPWLRLAPPRRVPWGAVARIDRAVHLAIPATALQDGADDERLVAAAPAERGGP